MSTQEFLTSASLILVVIVGADRRHPGSRTTEMR